MKYLFLFLFIFLIFSCRPLLLLKEYKAKSFMKAKIKENYNKQYKVEFAGTWHEFGRVYGFQFYIVENKEKPIVLEYYLPDERPFQFNKDAIDTQYQEIKKTIKDSEELEKSISRYFPNGKVLSKRIKNKDSSYRYVNSIYTALPLVNDEKTFRELDSLCKTIVNTAKEKEIYYNFYFAKEADSTLYSDDKFVFFAFDNFSKKYTFHYRVDFQKMNDNFEIVNRKLNDHFDEEQRDILKQSIEKWKRENIDFKDWKLSLIYDDNIKRDVLHKKFMLMSALGEKKFGYIHTETLQISLK